MSTKISKSIGKILRNFSWDPKGDGGMPNVSWDKIQLGYHVSQAL